MFRARVEAVLAGIAAVLTVVTLVWPTWIESLSGLEPDGGTGETERWLAAVFAVAALVLALLSWRDGRRLSAARPSSGEGG